MPTRLSLDLHGRQGETKVQGRRPTWYHDKHVKIEMIRLSPTQTPLVAATVWILNSYVLVHGEDQLVRKSFIRVASENKNTAIGHCFTPPTSLLDIIKIDVRQSIVSLSSSSVFSLLGILLGLFSLSLPLGVRERGEREGKGEQEEREEQEGEGTRRDGLGVWVFSSFK
ncbi:unnamed protein product [Rhizophagus irregularis]|nr:unnamed protein product [Rhizophagus irregularis]